MDKWAMKILFSFSSKDLERLRIEDIAFTLEKEPKIEKVYIYTRDTGLVGEGDIIRYMEKAIEECQVVVLFCTEHIAKSSPIFLERGTSQYLGKTVIPVAEKNDYIPTLLKTRFSVKITEETAKKDLAKIVEEIYKLIITSSPQEETTEQQPLKKFDEQFLLKEALGSRQGYNENCARYLATLPENIKKAIKEKSPLIGEESFSYPAKKELVPQTDFYDTICSLVSYEGKRILIMPSGKSNNEIEGVGRTNLLLRLMGYDIKYNQIFGLDEPRKKIQLDLKKQSKYTLLASDMVYLGLVNENLCAVPTRGEVISFIWDIARNIYRSSEIDYERDKHRKEGREKLLKIFGNIELTEDFVRNAYGQMNEYYFPTKVFVLKRDLGRFKPPKVVKIKNIEEIKSKLKTALLVSLKHGSNFWRRDEEEIKRIVNDIVQGLDLESVEFSEIRVTFPDPRLPPYIFDDIMEIIEKGSIEEDITGEQVNKFKVGIRYHNYHVYERLADVYKLEILVTSGQKFFNDISLWEKLARGRRELELRILFLDPNSKAAKEREEQAYKKYEKEPGYLKKEIYENIDEIKRMTEYLNENYQKTNIKVKCRLYKEKPIFRMTFINDKTLLLAIYPENKRTGAKTKFFIIERDKQKEFYEAFKNEYERIFAAAEPIK
ncbi:MAG: TIR domain-containing protein [Candidatus Heimdallarchaeota archaeon]|nr:TIR domain-containing protein [Candidatus Heimdallarchaeota archaeon]